MEKDVEIGQLIAGKYRVEQVLGRGGMGVVMAALHEQLNQRVALKFLTDAAYQQPEAVARFQREARAAVQIQSEHVARVMDVGTLETGAPFMVMEYLRGRDLKDVSTRRGPLPITEAVDYVLQACDAVAEAHALGIIHRDLKPSNLFLTERPDGTPLVKVLDFGISKALHAGENSQLQMTASAAIMGSPQYMSPEQIRSSKNVDARADIWALGTILHELLAGSPAYVADTIPGLLAMIVADSPPPLSSVLPNAPADLEAAILRCLQKDRAQRFATVAEFARSLERYASNETRLLVRRIARVLGADMPPTTQPISAAPFGMTLSEPIAQTNGTWANTGKHGEWAGRSSAMRRPEVLVGAAAGVIALGLLSWFFVARSAKLPEEAYDSQPAGSPPALSQTALSQTALSQPASASTPHPAEIGNAALGSTGSTSTGPATTAGMVAGGAAPRLPSTPPPVSAADRNAGIHPIADQPSLEEQRIGAPPSDEGEPTYVDEAPEARKKAREARIRELKREREAKGTSEARQSHGNRASGQKTAAHAGHAVDDQNGASSTPAPTAAKKGDTLDLFNDTK